MSQLYTEGSEAPFDTSPGAEKTLLFDDVPPSWTPPAPRVFHPVREAGFVSADTTGGSLPLRVVYGRAGRVPIVDYSKGRRPDTPAERDRKRNAILLSLVGLVILLAIGFICREVFQPPIPAPTGYDAYASASGSYTIDHPLGWNTFVLGSFDAGTGDVQEEGVRFENATAFVQIRSFAAANETLTVAHMKGESAATAQFSDYWESGPRTWTGASGPIEVSAYTCSGGMAGSFTGYRATVLGTRSTYSILCQCRYSDWPTLKPAFDRMIKSLTIRDASQVAVPAPLPPMTVLPAPAVPVYNPVSQPAQPVQPAQPSSESSPPGAAVSVLPTPIPGSASQRTITAPDQPFIPAYGVSSQAPETGVGQTDPAQSMRPEPSSTNDPPANSGPN